MPESWKSGSKLMGFHLARCANCPLVLLSIRSVAAAAGAGLRAEWVRLGAKEWLWGFGVRLRWIELYERFDWLPMLMFVLDDILLWLSFGLDLLIFGLNVQPSVSCAFFFCLSNSSFLCFVSKNSWFRFRRPSCSNFGFLLQDADLDLALLWL